MQQGCEIAANGGHGKYYIFIQYQLVASFLGWGTVGCNFTVYVL
jgi:hypothetical protein